MRIYIINLSYFSEHQFSHTPLQYHPIFTTSSTYKMHSQTPNTLSLPPRLQHPTRIHVHSSAFTPLYPRPRYHLLTALPNANTNPPTLRRAADVTSLHPYSTTSHFSSRPTPLHHSITHSHSLRSGKLGSTAPGSSVSAVRTRASRIRIKVVALVVPAKRFRGYLAAGTEVRGDWRGEDTRAIARVGWGFLGGRGVAGGKAGSGPRGARRGG